MSDDDEDGHGQGNEEAEKGQAEDCKEIKHSK